MPDANIGASGWVFAALETSYGTAVDPTVDDSTGVYVPVLNENLIYTEPDRYYSEQIRQEVTHSDVKPSYYHAEGDIQIEVDPTNFPIFLPASRHTVTKTGTGPYLYEAVPSKRGATYPGSVTAKGLTVTVQRNNEGFMYAGCVANQLAFTIENGVLRCTLSMLGLSENEVSVPAGIDAIAAWVTPNLLGADSHAVYIDAAGTTPAFATPDATFNGFTATINHNGEPRNNVVRERSATYIKYGISELSFDSELDFVDRTEYDNMKNVTLRAIRFESVNPGGAGATWGAATSGFRITFYRSNYDTYEVSLGGMGDLIMARVTGRGLVQAGGVPYRIEVKSPTNFASIP